MIQKAIKRIIYQYIYFDFESDHLLCTSAATKPHLFFCTFMEGVFGNGVILLLDIRVQGNRWIWPVFCPNVTTHNSYSLKSVEKKLLRICVCGSCDLLWPVKWNTGHNNTEHGATSSFKNGAEVTTGHLRICTVHFHNISNDPWRIQMFLCDIKQVMLDLLWGQEGGEGNLSNIYQQHRLNVSTSRESGPAPRLSPDHQTGVGL